MKKASQSVKWLLILALSDELLRYLQAPTHVHVRRARPTYVTTALADYSDRGNSSEKTLL